MKKPTILIVGGSQEQTFKKIGKRMDCTILFHQGKSRNGGVKKNFAPLVRKADCVVVLLGACGHEAMFNIKELGKEYGTEVVYQRGFGASGAITAALEKVGTAA